MKKIVFVTHEFGLFKGHGGIASYLYMLVQKIISEYNNYTIDILTFAYDKKCTMLKNKRIKLKKIKGSNLYEQGEFICHYLCKLKPDIVESTDYLGLCLNSLVYRMHAKDNELRNTVFITLHHTASRESFEWNEKIPVEKASPFIKECFIRERTQMKLSDLNVAPSLFMQKYVSKNYKLEHVDVIYHPFVYKEKKKNEISEKVCKCVDTSFFCKTFIVSCISRVEGRKNQLTLVQQFIKFLESTKVNAALFLIGNSSKNQVTGDDFRIEIYQKIPAAYRSKIHFFDFMDTDQKEAVLSVTDVSILASTYECLSLSMLESILTKTPVICSSYCGLADYMGDIKSHMTFDPFKKDDLFDKIIRYYKMNEAEKERIMQEQEKGLAEKISLDVTVRRRLDLYNKASPSISDAASKVLIVSYKNFRDIITEEVCESQYSAVLVHFYVNHMCGEMLAMKCRSFGRLFSQGDVICLSDSSTKVYFIDILHSWHPFIIQKISIDRQHIGMTFENFILSFVYPMLPVYCFNDIITNIMDKPKIFQNDSHFMHRELFRKRLIDGCFYNENIMNLESYV